tara:strand:+ start:319 stop:603 length:285 start_codon:yes stop_codon:yes gene_type:complete
MKPYFVVYSKKRCTWCKKAIDLLNERKERYIVTDLTKNKEVLEEIKTVFGHETVPIILLADNDNSRLNLIGGYTDLKSVFEKTENLSEKPAKDA